MENDWTFEKSNEYIEKAKVIGQDLLNESKALGLKLVFTTKQEDREAILKRLKMIEQESIVLKKICERIMGANLGYMIDHLGEE